MTRTLTLLGAASDSVRTEQAASEVGDAFREILGDSPGLRRIRQEIETVSATTANVLLYGETGTGKELVAKAIHACGVRARGPFVPINCGAIPSNLLESELFGHERGAFTGALTRRTGRFELAHDGTLFLDEIGEMALELQPKLLRVLQEREFERLGCNRTITTNARVVAATNRDLEAMVAGAAFREDLYYRLNVFPIRIPPLRERREDIPLLAETFVRRLSRRMQKPIARITPNAISRLLNYDWPGNVRELQNVLERAMILAVGPELDVHVGEEMPATTEASGCCAETLEEVERAHILRILRRTNGVVGGPRGAASLLGMKRTTLAFRMKKLGITRAERGASGSGPS